MYFISFFYAYQNKSKLTIHAAKVIQNNADKNRTSAILSILSLNFSFFDFRDKKEHTQLLERHNIATTANSSKYVEWSILEIRKDVRIIKQNPKRLEDAFKI